MTIRRGICSPTLFVPSRISEPVIQSPIHPLPHGFPGGLGTRSFPMGLRKQEVHLALGPLYEYVDNALDFNLEYLSSHVLSHGLAWTPQCDDVMPPGAPVDVRG